MYLKNLEYRLIETDDLLKNANRNELGMTIHNVGVVMDVGPA